MRKISHKSLPNHEGGRDIQLQQEDFQVAIIVRISKVAIIMKNRKETMTAKKVLP
jgi:hypothetical protein